VYKIKTKKKNTLQCQIKFALLIPFRVKRVMKKKSGVDRPAISLVTDNDLSLRYWDVFLKPTREYVIQFTLLVSSRSRSQQGLVNL